MSRAIASFLMTLVASAALAAEPAATDATQASGVFNPPISTYMPSIEVLSHEDRDVMIYVRITVSRTGTVTEAELMPDVSFYDSRSLANVLREAKAMRFKPATLNGKPVETKLALSYIFCEQGCWTFNSTYKFHLELEKLDDLFKKGDYAAANELADTMRRHTVKFGYEFELLKAALARNDEAIGEDELALRHAEEAIHGLGYTEQENYGRGKDRAGFSIKKTIPKNKASNYLMPAEFVETQLLTQMRIATRHGLLAEALQAYYQLAGLEEMAPDDPRAQVAAQITAKLESTDPLIAKWRIIDEEGWYHPLVRSTFSLDNVHGNIKSLQLMCGHNLQKLDYVPGEQWSVPPGWQQCGVKISAAPDTTFDFVETVD